MTHDTNKISKVFCDFYSKFYNIPTQYSNMDPEAFYQYILETSLTILTADVVEDLEAGFSTEEVKAIIASLVPSKNLSADGFASCFYKKK